MFTRQYLQKVSSCCVVLLSSQSELGEVLTIIKCRKHIRFKGIYFNGMIVIHLSSFFLEVPDDVFATNFIWKGSYDYKSQKQPMTLTVTSFNATTGKVNVTLTDSSMEFLLSGESSINHWSVSSSVLLLSHPLSTSVCHFHLF